jgi:hypothetical protein
VLFPAGLSGGLERRRALVALLLGTRRWRADALGACPGPVPGKWYMIYTGTLRIYAQKRLGTSYYGQLATGYYGRSDVVAAAAAAAASSE